MKTLDKRQKDYVFSEPPRFTPVTREQIYGVDTLLKEIDLIIRKICNFQELNRRGIRIGGGAFFYGPMGTGKTFLAQYVATVTQDHARFIDVRRFPRKTNSQENLHPSVKDLRVLLDISGEYVKEFQKPVILFFDEFERADGDIIEELRIQLCGIEEGINGIYFLLTSTSEPDEIDERLFRPGRINDLVRFTELSAFGQRAVLAGYFKESALESAADLESIAYLLEGVPGMDTPAAIKNFRERVLCSLPSGESTENALISSRSLLQECVRRITGQPAEEVITDQETLWVIALHEGGHAALARMLGIPLKIVSILPSLRPRASHGKTLAAFPQERVITRRRMLDYMAFNFGGMAAEKLFGYGDVITQEDDLKAINYAARMLVETLSCGYEMRRRFGYLTIKPSALENSEEIKKIVERDAARLIQRAERYTWKTVRSFGYDRARRLIGRIAVELLEKKILLPSDLDRLFNNR